jgi:hypothetical protein
MFRAEKKKRPRKKNGQKNNEMQTQNFSLEKMRSSQKTSDQHFRRRRLSACDA